MREKCEILKEELEVLNELLNDVAASPNPHKNDFVYNNLKNIIKKYKEQSETLENVRLFGKALDEKLYDWRLDGMTEEAVGLSAAVDLFEQFKLDRI